MPELRAGIYYESARLLLCCIHLKYGFVPFGLPELETMSYPFRRVAASFCALDDLKQP